MQYTSLVSLVELLLKLFWALARLLLALHVLLLSVVIVEGVVHVLVIINPSADHVRVLLVEVNTGRLSMEKNWLIVANLISCQSGGSVKKHLTPKV